MTKVWYAAYDEDSGFDMRDHLTNVESNVALLYFETTPNITEGNYVVMVDDQGAGAFIGEEEPSPAEQLYAP